MVRLGLFLYDHLARREVLPGSAGVDLGSSLLGAPLKPQYARGFVYSDGWVDDARLVVLSALDARERGAEVLTQCPVIAAHRDARGWTVTLANGRTVRSAALINAAGPWAESFLREVAAPAPVTKSLRLLKGSHIVVKRCVAHDHAYIFQNPDRRIVFATPYEGEFTLIGTTDVELAPTALAGFAKAQIEASEVDYLCAQASRYFVKAVTPADVVWSYAGVRPLLDDVDAEKSGDPSAVTCDYLLEPDPNGAPLLSVWGGKITTLRKLAEDAADLIGGMLNDKRSAWTEKAHLPGGDLQDWIGAAEKPDVDFARFVQAVQQRHVWLPPLLAHRLARAYGSRIGRVLGVAQSLADLGPAIARGLHDAELRYLVAEEWACNADDVLWRRSKLGLHFSASERDAVAALFQERA